MDLFALVVLGLGGGMIVLGLVGRFIGVPVGLPQVTVRRGCVRLNLPTRPTREKCFLPGVLLLTFGAGTLVPPLQSAFSAWINPSPVIETTESGSPGAVLVTFADTNGPVRVADLKPREFGWASPRSFTLTGQLGDSWQYHIDMSGQLMRLRSKKHYIQVRREDTQYFAVMPKNDALELHLDRKKPPLGAEHIQVSLFE